MSAASQEEIAQIAANKWPACSQTGLDMAIQKLRAQSHPAGWLTGTEGECSSAFLSGVSYRLQISVRTCFQWKVTAFGSSKHSQPPFLNMLMCLPDCVQHRYGFRRYFLLFFKMVLMSLANTSVPFTAFSSLKEAYKPKSTREWCFVAFCSYPILRHAAKHSHQIHMMFVNLHRN